MTERLQYRSEIDGLRTLAVVPVVLFHAGFSMFAGGFIGVDVFFVISGYLITGLIVQDIAAGSFSIWVFYERRARRILPALLVLIAATVPFAWALMLPSEFASYARSVIAACLFISNFHFWNETDYFRIDAEEMPLLHTWSLAVEEQFYIFFPLVLLVLWRFGRSRAFWALIGFTILSFILSEIASYRYKTANFFFLPTRGWELLAGSICALVLNGRRCLPAGAVAQIGSLAGLILIVGSVIFMGPATRFPSVYALAPVGGAVLIVLCAGPGTWIGKLLSLRLMVGLGLISYSTYLWHQPLFAFTRLALVEHPPVFVMLALASLSFGVGWVSWRFVENPFRRKDRRLLATQTSMLGTSAALLLVISAVFVTLLAYPDLRRGSLVAVTPTLIDPTVEQDRSWMLLRGDNAVALFEDDGATRRILVVGDSHSKDVFNALYQNRDAYPATAFARAELNMTCVRSRFGRSTPDDAETSRCMDAVLYERATHIILSQRWASKGDFEIYLARFIATLQADGKRASVTSSSPEYDTPAPDVMRRLDATDTLNPQAAAQVLYAEQRPVVGEVNAKLRRLVGQIGVPFLSKQDYICDEGLLACASLGSDNEALYYDYGHYTLQGAAYMGERMLSVGWLDPVLAQ